MEIKAGRDLCQAAENLARRLPVNDSPIQSLRRGCSHTAVTTPPVVERRIADSALPADDRHGNLGRMPLRDCNDLLFAEPVFPHPDLPPNEFRPQIEAEKQRSAAEPQRAAARDRRRYQSRPRP